MQVEIIMLNKPDSKDKHEILSPICVIRKEGRKQEGIERKGGREGGRKERRSGRR